MKGYSNHFLMSSCTLVSAATTIEKYGMFANDFPFVTSKVSKKVIRGEVYSVHDQPTLDELDILEGHPDEYARKMVKVVLDNDPSVIVEAEMYFNEKIDIDNPSLEQIESGDYRTSYNSKLLRSKT